MALHGGIITRRPLCYSADGRLIIAPCGNDVRVYSAKSGEHLATLRGHTAEVTAVAEDGSSNKLLSASRDGTLRQWDVQEGVVLQSWSVGAPIESMVYSIPAGVAYLALSHKGGQAGRVVPLQLPAGTEGPGKVKTSGPVALVLSPSGHHVATVDRHSCFVWAAGASATGRRAKPLNLPHSKPYTCVAFDPSDSTIAMGDASGRILLWHGFARALGRWAASAASTAAAAAAAGAGAAATQTPGGLPPCTTVHWHASAVGAVAFSLDGCYLFSGGQEGVLVRWALPNNSRTYLPRLGGPIAGIATCRADPSRLLVSHSDNAVRLINAASWRVEVSIQGLRPPPAAAPLAAAGYGAACSAGSSSPAGAVVQPLSGHVVLPAAHASLQFFDMARDRHVARLQACPRNPVLTAPGSQQAAAAAAAGLQLAPPLSPSVVLAGFTGDGRSLITVDVRPSTSALGGAAESTLRFWDATPGGQVAGAPAPFALNTAADNPHAGPLTGLAVHPSLPLAVTTGREGSFRTWAARSAAAGRGQAASAGGSGRAPGPWRCAAVGGYKSLPLTCCAFSADGSLLGIGAGAALTLWDPLDASLVTSLVAPQELAGAGHELRQLAFLRGSPHVVGVLGGGDPAAALAAVTPGGAPGEQQLQAQLLLSRQRQRLGERVRGCYGGAVVVWNLLTQAVSWYASLPVCSMAADPCHPVFAVGVPALLPAPGGGGGGGDSSGNSEPEQFGKKQRGGQQQQEQEQQQQDGEQQEGAQEQQAQQRQQQPAVAQGLVLVFGPHSPDPLYACPVPGSNPSSLLFMPPRGAAAAASAGAGSSGRSAAALQQQQQAQQPVSPLVLLTDDRRYTRLALGPTAGAVATDGGGGGGGGGSAAAKCAAAAAAAGQPGSEVPSGTRAALEAELAAGRDASALEAMFGKMEPQQQQQEEAAAAGASAAEAAAVKAAVAQLFDAPSHVLPAPSSLCPTLLELLTGAAGRRQ